jgi:hypothetical protein
MQIELRIDSTEAQRDELKALPKEMFVEILKLLYDQRGGA